jgi:transaldolase
MTTPTARLAAKGVSIWLDDLSRRRILSGNLAELISSREVTGVTTNPTIFASALAQGEDYQGQVARLAKAETSVEEAIVEITADDVRSAAELFRPVWERTGGVDGRVSIEVSPELAHDTQGTIAQAKQLWALVDRPNAFVRA